MLRIQENSEVARKDERKLCLAAVADDPETAEGITDKEWAVMRDNRAAVDAHVRGKIKRARLAIRARILARAL